MPNLKHLIVFSLLTTWGYNNYDSCVEPLDHIEIIDTTVCYVDPYSNTYVKHRCSASGFATSEQCNSTCEDCQSSSYSDFAPGECQDSFSGTYTVTCESELVIPTFDHAMIQTFATEDCSGDPWNINYYPLNACNIMGEIHSCADDVLVHTACTDDFCLENCVNVTTTPALNACLVKNGYGTKTICVATGYSIMGFCSGLKSLCELGSTQLLFMHTSGKLIEMVLDTFVFLCNPFTNTSKSLVIFT